MLVVGSGERVQVGRKVAPFSRIEITCSGVLEIEAGQPQSVSLELDDNLVTLIRTEVKRDTLTIGAQEDLRSQYELRVKIALPEVKYLGVLGAARAEIRNVEGEELAVYIGGAGTIRAAGRVEREALMVDGTGGEVDLYELVAREVTVRIAGVANAKVTATESLRATITGVGHVTYRGSPRAVERNVLGVGTVAADRRAAG